jgi:CRP-like cAMP-binding protein
MPHIVGRAMKRMEIAESADAQLADRLAEALRKNGPLVGLHADAAAAFIRLGALVELEPGEALIREDDEAAPEIYLLVEGTLVVQSHSGLVARLSRPGDVIGEVAVLLSSRRTADVIAESVVRVLAVPTKALALPEYAEVSAGVSGAMIRDDWVKY